MVDEPDIWSRDLDTINAHVRREGLLADVFFDYDRSDVRPDATDRLRQNARFLQDRPEFVVSVEGHCDERGTNEYNLGLGDRRARAVSAYLASLGVAQERLRTISFGKERPQCYESHEGCWQTNRRAHFVIVDRR